MCLTMGFVCLPSFIIQTFSVKWYITDETITNRVWITHILQMGVFYRYLQLLITAWKVRLSSLTSDLKRFNQEQSDICMLRLFESFTESAPQLVLQLYIMISANEWNIWTGVSAVASVISLSWGISAYSKAMRNVRPEKKHLSWWGLILQALWQIGMVSSRIIALVLFAMVYGAWLIVFMTVHWLCMTVWIILQNTDFCASWWEERLYNAIMGVIYCFCFFNLKEGSSRYRMLAFYTITVTENLCFVLVFYFSNVARHGLDFMVILVPVGTILGVFSMLLYYRFHHPSGPILLFKPAKQNVGKAEVLECRTQVKLNGSTLTKDDSQAGQCNSAFEPLETEICVPAISPNRALCQTDLHRSHSLNCSYVGAYERSEDAVTSWHANVSASRYRNVNYNFRSAVVFGKISLNIHCSCLVLTQDYELTECSDLKLSTSLPNLRHHVIEMNESINSV